MWNKFFGANSPRRLFDFGGGGSSGGGGGGTGKVDFPDYMKQAHKFLLDEIAVGNGQDSPAGGVNLQIDNSVDNSPFATEAAYDPSSKLAQTQLKIDDFVDFVEARDHKEDWTRMWRCAQALLETDDRLDFGDLFARAKKAAACLADPENVDRLTEAQEMVLRGNLARSKARVAAGFGDINAAQTSAFVIAMALLESDFNNDLAQFDAQARLEQERARNAAALELTKIASQQETSKYGSALQAVQMMMSLLGENISSRNAVAQLQGEVNRVAIVAKKEQVDVDRQIAEQDALWNLTLYQYGANVLGAIGGGTAVYKSKASGDGQGSSLGGVIGGALAGVGLARAGDAGAGGQAAGGFLGGLAGFLGG